MSHPHCKCGNVLTIDEAKNPSQACSECLKHAREFHIKYKINGQKFNGQKYDFDYDVEVTE
jgi:hypothetical protein